MKPTTKQCPKCGNPNISSFPSLNKKYCTDCEHWFDWYLEKGQQSLIQHQR